MDYGFLQHYWWFLISLIAGIFAFLLFVQGGQSMLFSLAKTEQQRYLLVNALGRKWEYTFTTLVTFGGAFFASFPLFYSTSFGGAYWVWMAILFCFIIQAVSYEYQSKPGNTWGKNTYRWFLFINGLFGTFLIGVAIATFFTGSEFGVNKANLTNPLAPVISQWLNPWHGLEALLNVRNLCLGLAVFFLARTLACLFFINRMADEELVKRSRKFLLYNSLPFVVFFLVFLIWTLLSVGYAVDPATKVVTLEEYKYFTNLIEMPVVFAVFAVGVLLVLYGIIRSLLSDKFQAGIWFSGLGTVLTVCCLLLIAGWNNTAYYPSSVDLQSSLTIENSSSSQFTLTVMTYVSFLVPFVLGYIIYAWRALERKKFDGKDLKNDGHIY
ncbi:cytochrome d ubiquinol oxidase subunit II [Dysgonomonas sp. PH5-45]|uniref:cytochrome d ubiquinol oxidase subunit II n=1 Tax=unclassified Dysgonomonas TaxID=2630389 RepID=UPI002474EDB3|nr:MULTISPECIES: cytochrome d ubiquinol oxidase subunit II [unclassified Dysgonomonas]MDH6355412.1 cytochrome d ubiquinol oxidase subunit II [Dysgonomonas sp. PH5-45]MDH6388309.1 cytochrome d ubiquinol oxidase subunit II [Dysgonomonas sp. PH5-37]